jgi:lysophospholipase L1-like esterase
VRNRRLLACLAALTAVLVFVLSWELYSYRHKLHELTDNDAWEARLQTQHAFASQRIVFFGDSELAYWPMAESFGSMPIFNRGVPGELVLKAIDRFDRDVIANHPSTLVLLTGTNDLGSKRPIDAIAANVESLVARAEQHSIRTILCSLLPASNKYLENHRPQDITALNLRYRAIASAHQATFVDFYSILIDKQGEFAALLTRDGLHPNQAGYALMTARLLPSLARSLVADSGFDANAAAPPYELLGKATLHVDSSR